MRKQFLRNNLKLVQTCSLIAGLFCMAETSLFAAVGSWTGAVSNNFVTAGNWSGAAPGSSNQLYINLSGANIMAGSGGFGGSDWIAAAGSLYVQGSGTAPVLNINVGRQFFCNNSQLYVGSGGNNWGVQ